MQRISFVSVLIGALLWTSACQERKSTFEELEGTKWRMIKYAFGGQIHEVIADAVPTAIFSNGEISGSTGCNRFFGKYEISDDNITISQIGSTEMACPGRMEQESQFLDLLQHAQKLAVGGEQLTIHSEKGEIVFVPDTNGM